MISEALTEETRRKEQRGKESNKITVATQEARSASASATTTVTGPAASPAGENLIEPDANPRERLLMKSALLTASSSREQGQERSISNGELRMQVQNIKWRIAVKSESAASTTQEATILTAVSSRMSADAEKARLMKKIMYGSRNVASDWKEFPSRLENNQNNRC